MSRMGIPGEIGFMTRRYASANTLAIYRAGMDRVSGRSALPAVVHAPGDDQGVSDSRDVPAMMA